jgi:hypothetical protein
MSDCSGHTSKADEEGGQTYLLEIWEKKTITVTAENFAAAVSRVPEGCMFMSVRKQGDSYEDRLTEYDWCDLCCQPMLQDKDGPVDRWAKIELDSRDLPFAADCVHESCADSMGRVVLERMGSYRATNP